MREDIQDFKNIINRTFENISCQDLENSNSVISTWKKILLRIKSNTNPNEGIKLSEHTRVIDLKNGILLVEADHPGWITLLQIHKKYIMKGLQMGLPELKINSLAIRLKGDDARLSDLGTEPYDEEKSKNSLKKRIEREEEQIKNATSLIEKRDVAPKSKKTLPPELSRIFEDLRNEIQRNDEN